MVRRWWHNHVMTFGKNLARLRRKAGLTLREMAISTGFAHQQLAWWERGENYPNIGYLPILAIPLGVSVSDFFDGVDVIPDERAAARRSRCIELLSVSTSSS